MKRILLPFVLVPLLILAFAVQALAWPGTVVAVHDGDSITVARTDTGEKVKIRLFGVDCPELAWPGRWETQPYGRKATDFVKAMFKPGSRVDVTIWEMGESYGRTVGGVIKLGDGKTVQEELVRAGLGWIDPRYCKPSVVKECANWMKLQQEAADKRRGLWRDLDGPRKPVAPWKWRKGERDE